MNSVIAYDRKQGNDFIPNGYPFQDYVYDVQEYINKFNVEPTVRFINFYSNYKRVQTNKVKDNFIYMIEQFGSIEKLIGMESGYEDICFLNHIESNTIEKIRSNKGKLVICAFEESRVDIKSMTFLHIKLSKLKINKLYYITGNNWNIEKTYKIWCDRQGVEPIISIVNSLEQLYLKGQDLSQDNGTFVSLDEIDKKRNKRFLCFNRRIRPHRYSLISMFHHNDLLKDNLVSFSLERGKDLNHLGENRTPDLHTMTQIMGKTYLRDTYISYFEELNKMSPMTVDYDNLTNVMGPGCENKEPYLETYFSVVTETPFTESTYFSTEKVYRPMIQYHPFIVFGAPGTLSNLKELGFKTFSPYIDESYDNEISPFRRMQKITKEIKRLCSLSETEIYNWFTSMKYILIYNRQLMLEYGKQYGKHMENIIGELK